MRVNKNMQQPWWSIYLLAIFMLGLDSKLVGEAFQPEFAEPLMNLTVPIGRDATFRCLVQNLGGYRVGWVKADTKAIQAIHVHVITNNPRVGVSHNGQTVWNLHIRNVQEEDRGQYMCQINTDPMKSQMGYLDVVIPPDFISDETSGDIMVPEGGTARVSCRARGMPLPRIMWRREDGVDIVIRDPKGTKSKVSVYEEEVLTLAKISRSDMGAYLCIASNGVPPTVSKRIMIKVHFHPVIQVPNQLVGAPLGTDVTLECYVESSPKSINYWVRDSNEMVISSNKYEVVNTVISSFESRMALTVRRLTGADVGGYRCVAKNSLGEVDSVIRLYEEQYRPQSSRSKNRTGDPVKLYLSSRNSYFIKSPIQIPGPTIKNTSPASREDYKYSTPLEGPDNQFGSADRSDDEDERDSIADASDKLSMFLNATKNRTMNSPQDSKSDQKLSNKVRKIINKLEINHDFGLNCNCSLSFNLVLIYLLVFITITLDLT